MFLCMLAVWICALNPTHAATNNYFAQGTAAYQAGQFPEAAAAFENAWQQQPASGAFVNLGLAEWQRGRAGAAILAWERAAWLNPFDVLAKQNLNFARTMAQVDDPQLKWFEAASMWLPPNAWVWIAGASLWLAAGAQVLPRFFRWRKTGWQQWLTALGCGVFLFSMTANFGVVSRTNLGFVVKRNAPLLLTPTKTGDVISLLTAGEPARKLKARGEYYFIRTAYGSGWIGRRDFGLVCPD
jgi:tetratricopeptide (TPR) repeat protein